MSETLLTETDAFDTYCIAVRPAQKPTRIDTFITESIKDISRSKVQELIHRGLITVNRESVMKASCKVNPGNMITVHIPRFAPLEVEAENIPLDVIYEDDDLIVINKPPGLVVHPAAGNRTGTLVNALAHRCTTLSDVGGVYRPGIVHRLDKDTSGAIIAAKHNVAHNRMARTFEFRNIEKYYLVLAWGRFTGERGAFTKAIGRHKRERQKYAAYQDERNGKPAETRYEVLESFDFISFLRVQILTGRTHQIRVHLSDAGHPVLGDTLYGGGNQRLKGLTPARRSLALEVLDSMKRQALHCAEMHFKHPVNGQPLQVRAALPEDMARVLKLLRENSAI
ncbi:MAG: RluA family pseudouridine synthase [Candidatus Neomarinimicrobiota bacterium]|jgi:23S rRNA pseudouridine1911/1915/1917 synthase|nr:RluA family pseudouridine synthase [Candidatus Neomarinimicrobiota bacterium]MDD3966005.1 RluA family pseudouridine synthase [Candidatus Neomarinimicrobiota bacterium]MDX9780203.1 RluA family pseudouridine synthase [bacterium]